MNLNKFIKMGKYLNYCLFLILLFQDKALIFFFIISIKLPFSIQLFKDIIGSFKTVYFYYLRYFSFIYLFTDQCSITQNT